jgi:hypothetical protein
MRAHILQLAGKLFAMTIFYKVKLTSDNGFYDWRFTLLIIFIGFRDKLKHTKHIPVIGQCNGGHFILYGLFIHLVDLRCTIKN